MRMDVWLPAVAVALAGVSAGCRQSPPRPVPVAAEGALPATEARAATPAAAVGSGGILARVNEHVITDWDIEQRLPVTMRGDARRKDPMVEEIRRRELIHLVQSYALVDAAREEKVEIDESDVDDYLRREREDRKLDADSYRRVIEQQYGVPFETFRDRKRDEALAMLLINRRMFGIYVTPDEMRRQYRESPDSWVDEEHVSYQMMVFSGARPEAAAEAAAVRRQLLLGADFNGLADTYDPASARRTRENVARGSLPPAIEKEVFSLSVGGISRVHPVNGDPTIFRVTARQERRRRPFEERDVQGSLWKSGIYQQHNARRWKIIKEYLDRASIDPPGLYRPDELGQP